MVETSVSTLMSPRATRCALLTLCSGWRMRFVAVDLKPRRQHFPNAGSRLCRQSFPAAEGTWCLWLQSSSCVIVSVYDNLTEFVFAIIIITFAAISTLYCGCQPSVVDKAAACCAEGSLTTPGIQILKK